MRKDALKSDVKLSKYHFLYSVKWSENLLETKTFHILIYFSCTITKHKKSLLTQTTGNKNM